MSTQPGKGAASDDEDGHKKLLNSALIDSDDEIHGSEVSITDLLHSVDSSPRPPFVTMPMVDRLLSDDEGEPFDLNEGKPPAKRLKKSNKIRDEGAKLTKKAGKRGPYHCKECSTEEHKVALVDHYCPYKRKIKNGLIGGGIPIWTQTSTPGEPEGSSLAPCLPLVRPIRYPKRWTQMLPDDQHKAIRRCSMDRERIEHLSWLMKRTLDEINHVIAAASGTHVTGHSEEVQIEDGGDNEQPTEHLETDDDEGRPRNIAEV